MGVEMIATMRTNDGPEELIPQEKVQKAKKQVEHDIKCNLGWAIWCFGWVCRYEYIHASLLALIWMWLFGTWYMYAALTLWRKFEKAILDRLAYNCTQEGREKYIQAVIEELKTLSRYEGSARLFGIWNITKYGMYARDEEDKKVWQKKAALWPLRCFCKYEWHEIERRGDEDKCQSRKRSN